MHEHEIERFEHGHSFVSDRHTGAERRTRWVVGLTLVMMVAEISGGMFFGSMSLLADGWHMGSHAAALGVAAFAYWFARRHAANPKYSFGTGKVGALGGFASAVGLVLVALLMIGESAWRLATPVSIMFDQAIAVAVAGLAVNLASAFILRDDHDHGPRPRPWTRARPWIRPRPWTTTTTLIATTIFARHTCTCWPMR